jgi:hypothetical protein
MIVGTVGEEEAVRKGGIAGADDDRGRGQDI